MNRDALLEISRQLMDEDPEKRSDVLDRLTLSTVDNAAMGSDSLG